MEKEYLGINAVNDLFDILQENYVSKEDAENKDKLVANSIRVGSILIAECLLRVAEAILVVKGAKGGETTDGNLIATESEVNAIINKYFGGNQNDG